MGASSSNSALHRISTGAVLLLLAAPAAAHAHGIGSGDPNRPVVEYLWLGAKHLLAGWDHLLFVLGIVLLAGSLLRATKLISWFVLGHSITLMLATTQEWTVSTTFVDIVIALSLIFVAGVAYRGRPTDWRPFGAALFIIGLVHGLGLGTRLLELGVSDNDLTWRILAFNVGVELGQAVAVVAFSALLLARFGPELSRRIAVPAFLAVAVAGMIGTVVIAVTAGAEDGTSSAAETENCTEGAASPPVLNDAGHPDRRFYEPGEELPAANFAHVVGDGYVVVTYQPDIPPDAVSELRTAIEGEDKAVVAGPSRDQSEALIARTARRTFTCSKVDVPALLEFRDAWFVEIYGTTQPGA